MFSVYRRSCSIINSTARNTFSFGIIQLSHEIVKYALKKITEAQWYLRSFLFFLSFFFNFYFFFFLHLHFKYFMSNFGHFSVTSLNAFLFSIVPSFAVFSFTAILVVQKCYSFPFSFYVTNTRESQNCVDMFVTCFSRLSTTCFSFLQKFRNISLCCRTVSTKQLHVETVKSTASIFVILVNTIEITKENAKTIIGGKKSRKTIPETSKSV